MKYAIVSKILQYLLKNKEMQNFFIKLKPNNRDVPIAISEYPEKSP